LTDLTFDLSSIYRFCKTTENEAALILNRFSPFRYFPKNLDFCHILSVIPDYEILQGETKRQGEETAKTYAENQEPNL
jgi:hypothetical protein